MSWYKRLDCWPQCKDPSSSFEWSDIIYAITILNKSSQYEFKCIHLLNRRIPCGFSKDHILPYRMAFFNWVCSQWIRPLLLMAVTDVDIFALSRGNVGNKVFSHDYHLHERSLSDVGGTCWKSERWRTKKTKKTRNNNHLRGYMQSQRFIWLHTN